MKNDRTYFESALDDCNTDDIFQEAERFKTLILENIEELAGIFITTTSLNLEMKHLNG